jgi:hypothetical protein
MNGFGKNHKQLDFSMACQWQAFENIWILFNFTLQIIHEGLLFYSFYIEMARMFKNKYRSVYGKVKTNVQNGWRNIGFPRNYDIWAK